MKNRGVILLDITDYERKQVCDSEYELLVH